MAVDVSISRRWLVAALLALTAVTGLVDAVSYLHIGHVFVANMTGNVVFIGFSLHPRSELSAVASAVSVGGFVLGALLGGRFATWCSCRPRTWLTTAFAAQAAVLALVAILGSTGAMTYSGDRALITIAVLATGMGLQNSTAYRLGARDLKTTVLTLTITGLAADSKLSGGSGTKPHRRIGSVCARLAGAAVGASLLQITTSGVLALSAILVAAVAIVFAAAPSERTARTEPPE